MIKKLIILLLSILLILSVIINIYLVDYVRTDGAYENSRISTVSSLMRIFQLPYQTLQNAQELLLRLQNNQISSEYILAVDTAENRIRTLIDELAMISGGVYPESGGFVNGYGTVYVQKYFYQENHVRSNARIYFNKILSDYLQTTDRLNIESGLTFRIKTYKDYYKDPVFYEMTIAESIRLLQTIHFQILSDKTLYLVKSIE